LKNCLPTTTEALSVCAVWEKKYYSENKWFGIRKSVNGSVSLRQSQQFCRKNILVNDWFILKFG
jgi:hypothetical protein